MHVCVGSEGGNGDPGPELGVEMTLATHWVLISSMCMTNQLPSDSA